MTDREFWSANDLKERWGLSRAQVYKHMEQMPRVRMGCKTYRVRNRDLLAFEKKQFDFIAPSSTVDSPKPSISCGVKRGEAVALQHVQRMRPRPSAS